MFELLELIYWLFTLRYMWIGLLAAGLLAAAYEQFDPGTSSDVYIATALVFGAIGLVLDIIRGLLTGELEIGVVGARLTDRPKNL